MLPLAPVFFMACQVAVSSPALGQHSHRATGHTLQLLLTVTDMFQNHISSLQNSLVALNNYSL